MYTSLLSLITLVTLVLAQDSPTTSDSTSPTCAAQPVLDACYASTTALQAGCSQTDYTCLCEKTRAVLTCFNQCPDDARESSVQTQRDTYCANVLVSAGNPSSNSSSTTSSGMDSRVSASSSGSSAGSLTSSAAEAGASPTGNSAGKMIVGGGLGLVGAVVGVFL